MRGPNPLKPIKFSLLWALFFVVSPAIAKNNNSSYLDNMKRPPWAQQLKVVEGDEGELKEKFADYILRHPFDPMGAARFVSNDNNYAAIYYRAREWPNDEIVLAKKQQLLDKNGPEYYLPTKNELVLTLWERVQLRTPEGFPVMADRDVINAVSTISEMCGFTTNGKNADPTNNQFNNSITLNYVQPSGEQAKVINNESDVIDVVKETLPGIKFIS